MSNPINQIKNWLPVLLVIVLIIIMSTTPGYRVGEYFNPVVKPMRDYLYKTGVLRFLTQPDWYKVGHVIAYGVLGGVLYNAFRHTTPRALLWSLLIVFAFACLDELVQSFVPGRSAAFNDVLLDTSSALIAMLGVKVLTSSSKFKGEW